MAFVEDPNKNLNTENMVAGSAPLSSTSSQADSEVSEPSGGQSSTSSSNSPKAKTGASGTNKRASSGMFTNIQNYINKNQPQAAKMADQSLANVKKAGDDIKKKQQESIQQFTNQANVSGLQNTDEQVQRVRDFTTQEAGFGQTEQPSNIPQQTSENRSGDLATATPQLQQDTTTASPVSNLTDEQFSNIINAKYSGPRGLADTGAIYQGLSKQADISGRIGDLAQTTQGREQLLKDDFTKGGRRYSEGSSRLDNLLLGQQTDSIQQMQDAARGIGSKEDILQNVSNQAQQIAADTSSAVDLTREQSREAFQNLSSERKAEVDSRINDVIENWDQLPAHFRNSISNPDGTVNISALEAATLGVDAGEGLYNLSGEDLFGTSEDPAVKAERERLISSGEQGNLDRLNALSQLAKGGDKLFDIGDYFDSSKAGTQSAFDALNLEGVREQLASAEKDFREDAAVDQTGVGSGSARYNKGLGRRGKVKRTASQSANLKDLLSGQGYNFDEDIQSENKGNVDYLKNLSDLARTQTAGVDAFDPTDINDLTENPLTNMATLGLGGTINDLKDGALDLVDSAGSDMRELSNNLVGKDLTNLSGVGLISDQLKGLSDLGSSIFGGGKSKAKKKATREAQQRALADLQGKISNQFNESGFKNRFDIADNEQTQQRDQSLMELLKNLDVTNK